jgi:hypothetical protein
MSIVDLVNIRELTKDDVNFLLDSSIQCLSKYTESIVKGQNRANAIQYLETIILYALHKMPYSIFIACDRDDPNNIIGYIVADTEKNHIFLQYTKYTYRGLGVQKNLLLPLVVDPSLPITVQWPTKEMLKLEKVNKIQIVKQYEMDLVESMYSMTGGNKV